ncbi:ABC transporter permease [Clostridium sp. 'deep sea']|uniref:ABC transporter permease n=1 Tax=Clostridium sp. 'deep sea' TaxID=2779445 RepID=UPI0018968067|nr:ABC transporter permease [Clostridium sp. 'deep sea']QOR35384.1 ABC transporter permease [Clostridium sp. 'deep sea']
MKTLFTIIFSTSFIYTIIRVTTPILLAALGALISDRAGIANIGLEGIMLMAALAGVIFSAYFSSALIGFIFALLTGVFMAFILAYFTLKLKTQVILGGIALNLLASGGSVFILYLVTGDKGTSAALASKVLPNIDIPLLKDIPILGAILSGHHLITYLAILSAIALYLMLNRTALGRKVRAVGENYHAAESVGINVRKIQYLALLLSGLFAGMGGAFLSMGYVSIFTANMSAGRGWIALAAEAMGRGTIIGTTLSSLLFGFAKAISNALQVINLPNELVYTVPYLATVLGLTFYSIKASRKKNIKKK